MKKNQYDYAKVKEVYYGIIGYNSNAGTSAGHETTNLSIDKLKLGDKYD